MIKEKKNRICLNEIGIICITLYMLTQSLYVSIFNSLFIQIIILLGIVYMLVISKINKKNLIIFKKTDIFFLIAIVAFFKSLNFQEISIIILAGPIILSLGIIISFLIRTEIEYYDYSIKFIKWMGIFYALSVIFSFILPNTYTKIFLSLLRPSISNRILSEMYNGYHTGFTGQVAYTAGYIVFALGVICCKWLVDNNKKSNIDILQFFILTVGLLLTKKRSFLLFFLISWFFIYLQYSKNGNQKLIKLFKIVILCFIAILILIPIALNTSFGNILFSRIIETVNIYLSGGDITSNRIPLYRHAWNLFLKNPLHGIGWGNYRKSVVGNVTVHTEMQAHNMYLQLLSETGLIGTILILLPIIITYFYTIRSIKLIIRGKKNVSTKWLFGVTYSLYIQIFFILYGLTGNPLYDYVFIIMYFIACGLIYSYWKFQKLIID